MNSAQSSSVMMTEVLSWQKVSPAKRIILSKRLSCSTPSENSPQLVSSCSHSHFSEASGDFRRNKIFPADLPDCDPPRLKDVLSFSSSLADSDLGTSVSQDLSLSRHSDRLFTKSARSSRKISRSSAQSSGSTTQHRDGETEAIFTIECLEVREGGEGTGKGTEYEDVRATKTSSTNSYRKYIIKKDHNHRKNRAVLAEAQQTKAGRWKPLSRGRTLTERCCRCS